ncbi:RidA family protein [Mesorhizobium sp. M7D.F.Ca.US.004.03.1.1]|uniref:RidA family protein n=1 Tax=Mesorhizobium sp. M7D.F.Ca.US.004.03.1.1 TaxID=2496702 RepID=UPI000FC9EB90|nr:RidA family protein [Mesorhizobium sp. M7D.F.Ca.US.004.03.1.1]RVA17704.1 RidA family protein [Mesorhizobium sp. M7D.F.Ca.US.004.03.1.1]
MSRIRRAISPLVAEPPEQLWSNCLVAGGFAYITGQTAGEYILDPEASGQTGRDDQNEEYRQAKIAFQKIEALICAAGGTMADVVKLTVYVTDMKRRQGIWAARREFFSGDFPCVTLFEVSALASPEFVVEIDAIAYVGS